MSISVEDLVASFSGSHIGQEATDLATLQAQLAQALFSQQIPPNILAHHGREDINDVQLCNTPTTRTRSSSFSFGQMGDMTMMHRRNSSTAGRSRSRKNSVVVDENWDDVDEMDEDEQMVEDLVTPSSPMSTSVPNFTISHHQRSSSTSSHSGISQNSYPEPPSASLFTTTDPFYIAQLQAAQNPQQATSIFAQSGRPAQHSPFLQHSCHQTQHTYGHAVTTSTAYER
ncbi:hypothetical protein PILCRDRAFT_421045 [Piloderma croceum F 1598]|uniref:Uncharacterized protein n=1 Tax=Piloderma croceum (strain F 1598) TaxID=765440 RepID=A0A0C3C331_PILCF|nr:hypothetical protein PILCRDRAFT_421045 [Piloderma croceum F 1598]